MLPLARSFCLHNTEIMSVSRAAQGKPLGPFLPTDQFAVSVAIGEAAD